MGKPGFYAVKVGRNGPQVYTNWDEARRAVDGFTGAVHKKFPTRAMADAWLGEVGNASARTSNATTRHPEPVNFRNSAGAHPRSHQERAQEEATLLHDPDQVPMYNRVDIPPIGTRDQILMESKPFVHQNTIKSSPVVQHDHIILSHEQEAILEKVIAGESLFFTGSAGTGKSVLLRAIIKELQDLHGRKAVAVTAPTGIAAVNIGGITLHSFAGVKLGKGTVAQLLEEMGDNRTVAKRWNHTRTLIIDEISMVDGLFFDKLEQIARTVRGIAAPFGGIQLVISGDFFQLPPVPEHNQGTPVPSTFAFDARCWEHCVPSCYTLTRVFRQKDQEFVDMLNQLRTGEVPKPTADRFCRLSRHVYYDDEIQPTQLFPKKRDVEEANNQRLAALNGPTYVYKAKDTPGENIRGHRLSPQDAEKSLERLVALKEVVLRERAQVMLIKNQKEGRLVNGSLGVVVDFITPQQAEAQDLEVAELEKAKTHLDDVSGPEIRLDGRTSGMSSKPVSRQGSMADGRTSGEQRWPVVEFTNGERLVLPPVEFNVVNFLGIIEATRVQIPLILSYALSIHKSQGQTLQRVKIDLNGTFEKGQAYVALSRATSIQTLQVLNFKPRLVQAHPRVIEWSKTLRTNEDKHEPAAEPVFQQHAPVTPTPPTPLQTTPDPDPRPDSPDTDSEDDDEHWSDARESFQGVEDDRMDVTSD